MTASIPAGTLEVGSRWRIESWSRQLGRGTVRSDEIGTLEFDASIATSPHFVVGEAVLVETEREGDSLRVTRVSPGAASCSDDADHSVQILPYLSVVLFIGGVMLIAYLVLRLLMRR